jgi:uncharacterized protein
MNIMMRVHVDQIKDKGLLLEFEEKPELFPVLADMIMKNECEFLTPIKARLRAIRIGDIVEVEGTVETSVRLSCGRCLKKFETILESSFTLTYTSALPDIADGSEEPEIELSARDIGLIYFPGEEIDFQEAIQEQVVLAFPLRPLCRETCKGLCPKCGADLNKGDCGCNQTSLNSKFAVLKNLAFNKK